MTQNKRLFLIDGHSLIFRMYYALLKRPMINSKGEDTSILFGFTKYILELIHREKPTHIAVTFDPPCKTFRHEIYPKYKANRSATPELVKAALDPLVEIMKSIGIPVLMKPGVEADDVIGTLAATGERSGFDVFMVTPDKDLGQMVSDHIFQYKPGKSGSDSEVLGKKEICEKYGIDDPKEIIDILTIWGDSADNIKGVTGVGEVGAKKLVGQYKTIENIYNHIDELTKRQQASFNEAKDHISTTKYLVTVKTDVELDISEEDLILNLNGGKEVIEMLERYEFNSLRPLLPSPNDGDAGEAEAEKEHIEINGAEVDPEELIRIINSDTDFESGKRYVSIRFNKKFIFSHGESYLRCRADNPVAKQLLEDENISKIGYNLKSDIIEMLRNGIEIKGELYDVEIMHYLLNPERTHKLDILAGSYLEIDLNSSGRGEEKREIVQMDLFSSVEFEESSEDSERVMREAVAIEMLFHKIKQELERDNLWSLYKETEMPLIEVLAEMEHTGVKIDPDQLAAYGRILSQQLREIEDEVKTMADEREINLSSPKQIGILLYEKLNLNPKAKKNKRDNYPTDEETLAKMTDLHPIVNKILEFRGVKKLLSTYIEPLPSLINPLTGKIHTTFNQALTATGRLSSMKPNLQNIPIRTEQGREIRKAFIPSSPDGFIVSADYSQIELRLMAELSRDEGMLAGFAHGADVHTATAAKVFKVDADMVTKEQRRQAKVANFGIIYGISPFGLAQRLKIPRREASDLIAEYFVSYPKVKEYMDDAIQKAKNQGFVETICSRKRFLPDIRSNNPVVRGLAERNAINAPIQGSAADIIKLSMINVYNKMKQEGLKSRMVLQVHDELVFDVVHDELERVMEIVKYEMEHVCTLSIPLSVECSYGKNWLEAH